MEAHGFEIGKHFSISYFVGYIYHLKMAISISFFETWLFLVKMAISCDIFFWVFEVGFVGHQPDTGR